MVGRILVPCSDLDETLEFFTATLGMRIERISPADAPREVDLSGGGVSLRLVRTDDGDGSSISLELDATIDLRAALDELQAAQERSFSSIPTRDWAGRTVDQMAPMVFETRESL